MYRCAQCVITHTEQNDHNVITRTREAQDCTSFVSQNCCHPRVMSCPLPHLTLTTSTSSLSSTSPIFATFSHPHPSPLAHDPCLPCDVPRQSGGSTQIPSLTGYEPKSLETKVIETEAIESEDPEPRIIDLDRNLGTDPYQTQERNLGENYQNPIAEDKVNLEKLVLRCPTSSHRCIPIMTQRKALQSRILKMENYEKCWLHRCTCRSERIMNILEDKQLQGKAEAVIIQKRGAIAQCT